MSALCQSGHMRRSKKYSFDHLVGGAGEHARRNCQAQRLSVLRLITSTNVVGWIIGKSAGLN
jgi:hypothetical protein